MRIGILGAASIARDRFLPSLSKQDLVKCVAIAARNPEGERIKEISERYNIDIYESYDAIIEDQTIDSVYIPLPPALHFEWAKKALNAGKNVFLEKPATITYKQIEELVSLAKTNNLA
ncbi:MAG TPA: Gfo/Idh/MocA family oxidoreductase, partial [Tissierellaceae bacterium]